MSRKGTVCGVFRMNFRGDKIKIMGNDNYENGVEISSWTNKSSFILVIQHRPGDHTDFDQLISDTFLYQWQIKHE